MNFDVPPHSIVIGNPGEIIHKENSTEDYINNLYKGDNYKGTIDLLRKILTNILTAVYESFAFHFCAPDISDQVFD